LMVDAMAQLAETGTLPAESQDENLVTYAHKLEKKESAIDWTQSAEQISRQVRAFNPFPVATAQFRGQTCKLWFATHQAGNGNAGDIISLSDTMTVACGEGHLVISELQLPGAKRQTAEQFIQGQHVKIGEKFT